MSTEKDAGANGKKTLSVIGLGIVIVLAGGYWFLSWYNNDSALSASSVNLGSVARSSGTPSPETPRYRELLKASNDIGAREASLKNTSFIASLPAGLDTRSDNVVTTPPPPPPSPRTPRVTPTSEPRALTAAEQQAGEKRKEAIQKLLTRISNAHGSGGVPVLATIRTTKADASTEPAAVSASVSGRPAATPPAQQLVSALTRVPASLETAVNSDNTSSQVIAVIPTGALAGARLHSSSVKLAGNGVEINFRKMSWRGMELNVNAYAQQETTLESSVATEVNHRWMTHIVLPAALGGFGDLGSLYKDANTQILQNNVSTITGKVGKPDGETVAGVILGGTAQKGSEVVSQEFSREPFKQVRVKQNEVISILFVDSVSTDDLVNPKSNTARPALTQPATLSVAEDLTATRLQESIEQRKAAIRRQYTSN